MTKIKAVIFDMDGVLIDAKDWHYEALNQALDLFGYKISRYWKCSQLKKAYRKVCTNSSIT